MCQVRPIPAEAPLWILHQQEDICSAPVKGSHHNSYMSLSDKLSCLEKGVLPMLKPHTCAFPPTEASLSALSAGCGVHGQ